MTARIGTLWFAAAGILSGCASLAHLAVIAGGPSGYRAFGAGERIVRLAQRGSVRPAFITLVISGVLCMWAIYAFSGAGLLPRLPLLRFVLLLITIIYLARAAALPAFLIYAPALGLPFIVWSSLIVLAFGCVHAIALTLSWSRLGSG